MNECAAPEERDDRADRRAGHPSPVGGGGLQAAHGFEIPFIFDNTRYRAGTRDARSVSWADQMGDAWVAFAATGTPNVPGAGPWPAYNPAFRETMVFGELTRVTHDPFGAERLARSH